jgi:DNA-binding MarR family transcriptional regulator
MVGNFGSGAKAPTEKSPWSESLGSTLGIGAKSPHRSEIRKLLIGPYGLEDGLMPGAESTRSEIEEVRLAVAAYVAAGADESVQQVITAVHRLSRRLNQWYDVQLAGLGLSAGEWSVLSALARAPETDPLTPTQLAATANIAPSSMTHRLDRMVERDLIRREPDPTNRTRVLVRLTDAGWHLYAAAIREANVVESGLLAGLADNQVAELAGLLELMITKLDTAEL